MTHHLSRWLSTGPENEDFFSDGALLGAMLRFEVTLAAAQAQLGLIPAAAAAAIDRHAASFHTHSAALAAAGAHAGSPVIPFVRELTAHVGRHDADAARYVHFGTTSQDVLDSAIVLCAQPAIAALDRHLAAGCDAAATLARSHASDPVLARTLLQPAGITTIGFQVAQWAHALARARARVARSAPEALAISLGGAAGNLAAYSGRGSALRAELAHRLGLTDPGASWHTLRDAWMALATDTALCTGLMVKIAGDVALRMQPEIAETSEPEAAGRGGSSAMPHKRNPVLCLRVTALTQPIPGLVAGLLAAMQQEHERALGNWQAEMRTCADLFQQAVAASRCFAELLAGLRFDPHRCRANIEALRGSIFSEALAALLAGALGKTQAQDAVAAWVRQAFAEGTQLRAVALDARSNDARLQAVPEPDIERAFDVERAALPAREQVEPLLRELLPAPR